MATITLDRPLYSIPEAARYLGLSARTLKRWLEGAKIRGRFYPPVIRSKPTGLESVTWAEFVEAGFLREYRGQRVPLQQMRPFIDSARRTFGVPYPLAHFKPLIDGKELVYSLQLEAKLPSSLYLVRLGARKGQVQWAEPVAAFLEKVEFAPGEDFVGRILPLGHSSPIAIDPALAFGIPQVGGVRTELLAEAADTGESVEQIAADYGLGTFDVQAALDWERGLRHAA
jgi:uncharacterized protein (DUF433 family)